MAVTIPCAGTQNLSRPLHILVGDSDAERRDAIECCAQAMACSVIRCTTVEELCARIAPDVGLVVIGVPGAEEGVSAVRASERGRDVPILAITSEGMPAEALLEAGADDVLRWPAQKAELRWRMRVQLRVYDTIAALAQKERDAKAMLELTVALASSLDFRDILDTVVRRLADVIHVDRVSIVVAPEDGRGHVGYLVSASDEEGIQSSRIDLRRYPEVRDVLRSRWPSTIGEDSTHPLREGVRDLVPGGSLGALTLLPILWQGEAIGALIVGAPHGHGAFSRRELEFCQIVAHAMAIALRNARIIQTLRDQTQQINFARFEAERRWRSLQRYANWFVSAADGLAAVGPDGQLLFANPRAYEIAGVTESEVRRTSLLDLFHPAERRRIVRLWRGVRRGDCPHGVDLRLRRRDGSERTISASFASLLEGEGAVLVSFRDVTAERETARELAKTKEFLESLIDASVDAIIAADLKGRILVFNKGAERIYGWRAEEVVGIKHISELYPPGVAREVMRMIRSPQYGGVGRLENARVDVVDREGRRIPINLSAAMVCDHEGKPSATVGIFTDLREKIRVEERLIQAQEKLAMSEKQALIAELAGTAAHELNQPLTSVIGYGQLLQRKLAAGSPEHHAASMIVQEAERIADIVRKIGKITHYETKSYVGAQKILDLDRACAERRPADRAPADRMIPGQGKEGTEG